MLTQDLMQILEETSLVEVHGVVYERNILHGGGIVLFVR